MLNKIINLFRKSKPNDKTTNPLYGAVVYPALRLAESGANDHHSFEWHEEDKWIPKGDEGEE